MTGNVSRISRAVTHRCCPDCGYLVAQIEVVMARINLECPRCGNHKVSKFQPIKMNEDEDQFMDGEENDQL